MKGTLTISRGTSSISDDSIRIRLRDTESRNCLLEITTNCESFTKALTGLAEQECEFDLFNLNNVGKKKVIESREILCPFISYTVTAYQDWLIKNAQENGCILDPNLRLRNSITKSLSDKKETLLRYSIIKYVDPTD